MNISATVSAEFGLRLVAAEQTIVPLVASLHYSGSDPYAIRMAFHVGAEDPVEWIFARDLLADGVTTPEGEGDVRIWPSSPDTGKDPAPDAEIRGALSVLNIKLSSPFGEAHFEAPSEAITKLSRPDLQHRPDGPGKRRHRHRRRAQQPALASLTAGGARHGHYSRPGPFGKTWVRRPARALLAAGPVRQDLGPAPGTGITRGRARSARPGSGARHGHYSRPGPFGSPVSAV